MNKIERKIKLIVEKYIPLQNKLDIVGVEVQVIMEEDLKALVKLVEEEKDIEISEIKKIKDFYRKQAGVTSLT